MCEGKAASKTGREEKGIIHPPGSLMHYSEARTTFGFPDLLMLGAGTQLLLFRLSRLISKRSLFPNPHHLVNRSEVTAVDRNSAYIL